MSQKVQKYQNRVSGSPSYGKYYVRAVYDNDFITTEELADFIQQQASVKRSDCKAVLDELGSAMKHFFEMGQKIKLDSIGIFKVGVSSSKSDTLDGCTAANVKNSRIIFSPETTAIPTGKTTTVQRAKVINGVPTIVTYEQPSYSHPAVMLKDVRFELAQDGYREAPSDSPEGGGE